tara:strand:- start:621 stop:1610 length:990 start_codon:yes stop_codon:yes gene_type:complete
MINDKKNTRRIFIKNTTAIGIGISIAPQLIAKSKTMKDNRIVISTWRHGILANKAAWKILKNNGKALDAVEKGVMVTEADPDCTSVGYGGMPDREGNVTLDACIMDEKGNCGAVSFLKNIKNAIAVARKVMEETPHIMLSGDGALQFALKKGFKKENLLTDNSKKRWKQWLKNHPQDQMFIDQHNHDTIGMIALDKDGNLSGSCTTSGLAWKYYGRVGDSPIIGSGLYVDNNHGAACATGKGEAVIKMVGSFLIVELMRQGKTPQEACELAIQRIIKDQSDHKDFQVGFLAINKKGEHGSFAIKEGFQYAINTKEREELVDSKYVYKRN